MPDPTNPEPYKVWYRGECYPYGAPKLTMLYVVKETKAYIILSSGVKVRKNSSFSWCRRDKLEAKRLVVAYYSELKEAAVNMAAKRESLLREAENL